MSLAFAITGWTVASILLFLLLFAINDWRKMRERWLDQLASNNQLQAMLDKAQFPGTRTRNSDVPAMWRRGVNEHERKKS